MARVFFNLAVDNYGCCPMIKLVLAIDPKGVLHTNKNDFVSLKYKTAAQQRDICPPQTVLQLHKFETQEYLMHYEKAKEVRRK